MRSWSRSIVAITLTAFAFASSGCFGSFRLVNKVYEINKGMGSKIVQELVFLVFVILPVYELASLADAIILNTIEFWTGSNPLSMEPGETQERVVEKDGAKATITFRDQGRRMDIRVERANQATRSYLLTTGEEGAQLRDGNGTVLAASGFSTTGSLRVRDGAGAVLLTRDAGQVTRLQEAVVAGPAALFALEHVGTCTLASR
jgi:hypothetical protein